MGEHSCCASWLYIDPTRIQIQLNENGKYGKGKVQNNIQIETNVIEFKRIELIRGTSSKLSKNISLKTIKQPEHSQINIPRNWDAFAITTCGHQPAPEIPASKHPMRTVLLAGVTFAVTVNFHNYISNPTQKLAKTTNQRK